MTDLDDHPCITFDSIMPGQWNDLIHRSAAGDPNRQLLAAILEDAVNCFIGRGKQPALGQRQYDPDTYQRYMRSRRYQLQHAAEQWIFDLAESEPPLWSFADVCDALDLNPEIWRRGIRQLAQNGRKLARARHVVSHNRRKELARVGD